MSFWEMAMQRLSVPGLLLAPIGALLSLWSPKLGGLIGGLWGERAVLPLRIFGLVLLILGALFLLEVIQG